MSKQTWQVINDEGAFTEIYIEPEGGWAKGEPSIAVIKASNDEQRKRARKNARLIAESPNMLAALKDIDLRCTQDRLANNIGSKTKQQQIDFLLGSLERIAAVASSARQKAEGQ